jgi:hypothetical protein
MGDDRSGHVPFDRVANVVAFDVAPPIEDGLAGVWWPHWGASRWPATRVLDVRVNETRDSARSASPSAAAET